MSEQSQPKISVLMSVRNGLPFVQQTVASLLGQTFTDFEFVIVDNASTDGTQEFLKHLASVTPRIRLFLNEQDLGHSGGLNRGLAECRANWIARIDADDVALPDRLERQWDFVQKNPGVKVTSCLAYYINERGVRRGKMVLDLTTEERFHEYMERNEVIGLLHPCVMMHRDVVHEVGGYREEFKSANDMDLWNRISERGHLILVQPEFLMEYRIHSGSISTGKFVEVRLKYEWVRACMAARRSGRPEPDWDTFLQEWKNTGFWKRANRNRKMYAKMCYRIGGENFVADQMLRGASYLLLAALLQPGYTIRRFAQQALPGKVPEADDTSFVPLPAPSKTGTTTPITVVIACHNGAAFIRQAIDGCLLQTQPPEEIVVVDDASFDGSFTILDEYARAGKIRLIHNETRQGKPESINRVFDTAKTKYVALLDADDVPMPNRFERQFAFMEAHPQVGCSSSFVRYINAHGKKIANGVLNLLGEEDLKNYMTGGEPFGLFCPGVIIRTEVLKNPAIRFRPQFWPADDIELWNRIAESGWQVLAQPEFLTQYRVHSGSTVTNKARHTRHQFEWVRACLRARRQGQPEPGREEFERLMSRQPWYVRLNRWRKIEAKATCRMAGFAYSEGHNLRAFVNLSKAFLLQPFYVGGRLKAQLFEP